MKIVKNDLFDYKNRYIFQDEEGYKFNLDAVLLAEFTELKPNDVVVEFCSGNMAIPLILSTKYTNKITSFEIQEEVCDIANRSIEYNNLSEQLKIINDDVNNISSYFKHDSLDVIICNPPFFEINNKFVDNFSKKNMSREEIFVTLEDIFSKSSKFLKNNGRLYMVHRANRLDELIILSNQYNVKIKEIMLINTKINDNIEIVLVKCVKNSSKSVKIMTKNVKNLKSYQNIFRKE